MLSNYPVANSRCIFDLRWCDALPGGREMVRHIIFNKLGMTEIGADPVRIARKRVNRGRYVLGAKRSQAPNTVDCSSFTQWVYGQVGMLSAKQQQQIVRTAIRVDSGTGSCDGRNGIVLALVGEGLHSTNATLRCA